MKTKRIVITGGPGSGKTSLIEHLENMGHQCIPEISREITLKAQQEGIDQLFLEKPLLFSERLLEGRVEQFHQGATFTDRTVFYDRGIPDVPAYLHYLGTPYPDHFDKTCEIHRYDAIFLLPPWEAIYERDNERYETYEQAEKIFHYLHKAYAAYGYEVDHVPTGSLKYRSEHILHKLEGLW